MTTATRPRPVTAHHDISTKLRILLAEDDTTSRNMLTEVLISLGVREFLSLGTAAGLHQEQSIGDVVALTGAVRDEGVSHHYLPPDDRVRPDGALTAALRSRLVEAGLAVAKGSTWTTDAPTRETA